MSLTTILGRTVDDAQTPLLLAEILDLLLAEPSPVRFTAYDGSSTGRADAEITVSLNTPRAAAYLATAPGSLGLARAYVTGELQVTGVHPGNPYALLVAMDQLKWRRPDVRTTMRIARSLGMKRLVPPPPPPQETLPDWRRALEGLRHSKIRDAEAIHHHYDVSNTFYEMLLGPSMTYTCAVYPNEQATLEEAQYNKYDLIARKLDLKPGMRLLDVGCGWGGMVRHAAEHYGVKALGVTLSAEQAEWAQQEIKRQGLEDLAEVRFGDYRDVIEGDFDAVSSIGLTEHIGVRNYPSYFEFLREKLRPGGRLLNHSIARPDNIHRARVKGGFIDRYIFPDGELTGAGSVIVALQNAGLEMRHEENLREHYARTCAAWAENLMANWDAAVAEVGEATAKIWGMYLAGCSNGFGKRQIELHQILAVRPDERGHSQYPLRHTFGV
ncbi:class I SAM-dependent methyltransferase [Kineosporia babensis]|uniref:Class I SAM-dependent methyltransferase n=1 Tax=Kineosporia babensis TaxID=499548 RepID=A0A9X1NIG4_9ACTN|nr:class I SAM-dependent methyltransferase [Kineosporia babensis]MCD5314655.1 class I SAM-dependent methyltransferase [Kineosporia babensis]